MSFFAFLPITPPLIVFCLCLALHFHTNSFSSCTSFKFPYFPYQNALEHARSRSLLQRTSPYPSTLFSLLIHSFSFYIFLSRTPLRSRTSHVCAQNSLKNARSRSLLQRRTSFFYPLHFPPIHPCTVDFTLTLFYCDCNAFFFTFCFPGTFLKNLFLIAILK